MILLALIVLASQVGAVQPSRAHSPAHDVALRRGMVITQSSRIIRQQYHLSAAQSLDSAIVVIRGDDVTVDFNGAELIGTPPSADPDEATGVAIRIDGGRNVRIINARVRGYRVAIMAVDTRGLVLADNDLSYNWKPRLFSVREHESIADWMSFHHNEQREWLRFGAGLYLEGVRGGELSGNRVEQGSNGIMLSRSDSLSVHDNDLSYNSALGLALYRSSHNTIAHNRIDYNVRGYSHGFFRRGQDSAGLLVYEQSAHNIVAWNSVTHGGDGLFLWAGQSTMDTGDGGANDNLFVGNDFSFAPTNGMEATFSRNDFIGNTIRGSDHGLWGGYSFSSRVVGNCFAGNRIGIAIEHGQDNSIVANHFDGDSTGVSLWANAIEPSDWGYPKHRDTRSRDYRIRENRLAVAKEPFKIVNTSEFDTTSNRIESSPEPTCDPMHLVPPEVWAQLAPVLPTGSRHPPDSPRAHLDRSAILVDESGPFDARSPKLWPLDSAGAATTRMRVVGPPGEWRMASQRGLSSISPMRGHVGDTIAVNPTGASEGRDWSLVLEYRGGPTLSPRGIRRSEGEPYRFAYDRFVPRTDWNVRFFRWADTTAKSLSADDMARLATSTPLLARRETRLDYMWYRPTIAGLPSTHVAAVATTTVDVPVGTFTLRTISDDAVRVFVDGALVVDDWVPHESNVKSAGISPGRHAIRVEYAQVDGWTELRVEIVRGRQRSMGTPGPH